MSPSRLREAILVFYRYPTPIFSASLLGALAVRARLGAAGVGDLAIEAGSGAGSTSFRHGSIARTIAIP